MPDEEKATVRRMCGYPEFNAGAADFKDWRFYQARGLLEYRMQFLTGAEQGVVRRYLDQLAQLEAAPGVVSGDTEAARLLHDWRRRLCGFLGVPEGPSLATTPLRILP